MVEYITYKGLKYPVRISFSALKHLKQETGKDVSEMSFTSDLQYIEILLWYGLVSGHQAESKPLELKREDVEFILDESLSEFNQILVASFPPANETSNGKKK